MSMTNETLQEFITNHLDAEDFGYLVLATDDRLNDEALCIIRKKLHAFLEGEPEVSPLLTTTADIEEIK